MAADWVTKREDASCTVTLPALKVDAPPDVELRAVTRLASGIAINEASRPPERTTLREYVWTCAGDDRRPCRIDVRLGSSPSEGSEAGSLALLLLAGLVLAGLVAAARG